MAITITVTGRASKHRSPWSADSETRGSERAQNGHLERVKREIPSPVDVADDKTRDEREKLNDYISGRTCVK